MRAALQVEAKNKATLRPFRPALHRGFREEIRNGAKAYHQRCQHDCQRLPPRKIQHRDNLSEWCGSWWFGPGLAQLAVPSSFAGSPLARTPEIIWRIWRTRTPSEISTSIWSSSTTLVTLPTRPPEVTTVSPRRMFFTR